MRIVVRLLIILALAYLGLVLIWDLQAHNASEQPDHTKTILYFGGIVLIGLTIGIVVALSVIPALGDWVAGFFYGGNEEIEKDPHAEAMAKIAQGDYPGAIESYQAAFEENPSDTLAISEIARIYCDRIGDPEAGTGAIEQALEREWPAEQSAFLCNRLVDIAWNYQHDFARARAVLIQIAEALPDTKYAANAQHRLHELDRAIESGALPAKNAVASESEPLPSPDDSEGEPT